MNKSEPKTARIQQSEIFNPPDISELKERVRNEIRALDTNVYDYEL